MLTITETKTGLYTLVIRSIYAETFGAVGCVFPFQSAENKYFFNATLNYARRESLKIEIQRTKSKLVVKKKKENSSELMAGYGVRRGFWWG